MKASVAQLDERTISNGEDVGSNPTRGTCVARADDQQIPRERKDTPNVRAFKATGGGIVANLCFMGRMNSVRGMKCANTDNGHDALTCRWRIGTPASHHTPMTDEELLALARHIASFGGSGLTKRRVSSKKKQRVRNGAGGKCRTCKSTRELRVHHRIPLSKGGTNELRNLVLLCKACEDRAHGRIA